MPKEISIQERGAQIYDELMEYLGAPELKAANIDSLEEQFADESAIDRAARHERYEAVFTEADRLLKLRDLGDEITVHEFLQAKRGKALEHETSEKSKDVSEAEAELESFNEEN